MPEAVTRLLQQFKDFWKNLDRSQKNRIYITTGILAVAIAAGLFMLTKSEYVTIVSSSDSKELKEMITILEDKKIGYKVVNGSIAVDSRDQNKAELELALAGYPKSGMTFESAFSMIKINSTESDKKKIWEEYKRSNLVAKLKMFDNVKDADVNLALPEPTLFEKDQKPTAVAIITPKDNNSITPEQAKNIAKVVASSVENLDPKDVAVVDNYSNLLNGDVEDDKIAKTNNQEEMRINKAKEMEKRVYNLLNGPSDNFDTLKVAVNPVLDFNVLESQTQGIKNPDGMDNGAVISEQTTKENLTNGNANGVPGTDTNPGNTNAPTYQITGNGNSDYSKSSTTINRDYTRYTTKEEKPIGGIIPDQTTAAITLWYGRRVTDEGKISQDFIDKLVLDVSKALGIPAANISVNKYKLAQETVEKPKLSDTLKSLIDSYGVFALMLLLVAALVIIAMPRKKKELQPAVATAGEAAAAVEGPKFVVPEVEEPLPEIDMEERSEVKKQIEKFVKQKPDAVAQLLRNWLSEEWE